MAVSIATPHDALHAQHRSSPQYSRGYQYEPSLALSLDSGAHSTKNTSMASMVALTYAQAAGQQHATSPSDERTPQVYESQPASAGIARSISADATHAQNHQNGHAHMPSTSQQANGKRPAYQQHPAPQHQHQQHSFHIPLPPHQQGFYQHNGQGSPYHHPGVPHPQTPYYHPQIGSPSDPQQNHQAMMFAAYAQQQAYFQQQMAMMASANNDPRRRTPSLPNPHPPTQAAGYFYAPNHQAPPPHLPNHSNAFHHVPPSHFHQPAHHAAGPYQRPSSPARVSSPYHSPNHQHHLSQSHPASLPLAQPQAPYAAPQRTGSPVRVSSPLSAPQLESQSGPVRQRTESQPSDPRHQPPQAPGMRDRADSAVSEPRHARHGTSTSVSIPANPPQLPNISLHASAPASSMSPSATLAARDRTDSSKSVASAESAARSASPASSDRASTPTALDGRTTPTTSQSPALQSGSRLGVHSAQMAASVGPNEAHRRTASSPLASSAESNRSITPTQSTPFVNTVPDQGEAPEGMASDKSQGHRNTPSNASSVMTSTSSSVHSPPTSASTQSSGKGSLFKNKLRKALSLSELNNASNVKTGRSSLSGNSSSSDTSHSTAEPKTPPNGAVPVLPNQYASASATNLHGRPAGPGASASLPGRRFGLLNSKMNSSTDNISISSTVSSASVMLRKMASFGKLGRKNSVRSLSNIFHRGDKSQGDGPSSDAVSEFGVPGAAISSPKDRKKGMAASPSIAHVTVEVESGTHAGMTPAEALVRKHQERERQIAEAEAAKRHAHAQTSALPISESPRSKLLEKEKEKLKNAGKKPGKKWGLGSFGRSASSSSLRNEAKASLDSPSPPDSAAPSPVFDSPAVSSSSASQSPTVDQSDTDRKGQVPQISLQNVQLDAWRRDPHPPGSLPAGAIQFGEDEIDHSGDEDDGGLEDRTPRQSIEGLGDQSAQYSDWDGEPPSISYFDDDTASFRASDSENTTRYFHEVEEYDDGGPDGRSGQKIPERPHPSARPAKGILKHARSYSQDMFAAPQPSFLRPRASSYDAPHQTTAPNQPGRLAALAQVIPSEDQVDGFVHHPPTAARQDTRAGSSSSLDGIHLADKENVNPNNTYSGPYGNPSLNASAPALAKMNGLHMPSRSVTSPLPKRKISFAQNLSVHTTWGPNIYDRKAEPATCNRLTPQLAQRIKEELNAFKMEEMEVVGTV